jgi:hypothetical protein
MKGNVSTLSLTMAIAVVMCALLIGPAFTNSSLRLAFAASDTSKECKDAADKISGKADASQSDNVCDISLSRDSTTIT